MTDKTRVTPIGTTLSPGRRREDIPEDLYERIKPRLRRRIAEELRPMRCILDLGCGNCDLEQYLAGEDQHVVTGVDVRDGSFPTAQDSAPVAQGLVNCIKADAAHLDFLGDDG